MSERDFYATLGVPRTASEAEIRKAYKALARKFHPDKNPGNKQAEDRFKDVAHASEVLLNKRKRDLYDEFGEAGLKDGFSAETARQYRSYQRGPARPPNYSDLFGGRGGGVWSGGTGGFQDFSGGSAVEDLFQRARRHAQPEQRPELLSDITLGFVEALRGGEHELQLAVPSEPTPRVLKVRVPAGVKDGGQIRLREQGIAGGDLVLRIHVEEHPHFRREDDDLLLTVPITVGEAYRGAKISVPTLEGEVTLTVPKAAKSGTKLRLRGKGVPQGSRDAGDLIVTLQIRLPDGEGEELERVINELEAKYPANVRSHIAL